MLYNVRYDGRQLFYRLSLSDMNIPYADPRHPYHKKSAFDLGDAGAGIMANDLKLGCDCLGSIHYLSATLADDKGNPLEMPNVVCIHEQDNEIGWKHTNYRTGRAAVVRNRELVVQSIITVANYEYIMAFMFNQAGELDYEVRATGILSTMPIENAGGLKVPWATNVGPGVSAPNHQHIFSLRIDPAIDGNNNSVQVEESHPVPMNEATNPNGNFYKVTNETIERAGWLDAAPDLNRTVKIINPHRKNPISGKPVAYKFAPLATQKLLADPHSIQAKRAQFAQHHVWVTKYRDGELYAGGRYTLQSQQEVDGVSDAVRRGDWVADTDVVVWSCFGITHNPRVEDWPVM